MIIRILRGVTPPGSNTPAPPPPAKNAEMERCGGQDATEAPVRNVVARQMQIVGETKINKKLKDIFFPVKNRNFVCGIRSDQMHLAISRNQKNSRETG